MNAIDEAREAIGPLRVVIVYDDIEAGQRAITVFAQISAEDPGPARRLPSLWKFDLFDDPGWRACATADANAADLLILATRETSSVPAAVNSWISDYLNQPDWMAGVVLTLFGPQGDWTIFIQQSGGSTDAATSRQGVEAAGRRLRWTPIATGRASSERVPPAPFLRRPFGSGSRAEG